jgi:protein N-terminal amidase
VRNLLTSNSPYKFEAPWSSWEFAYHVLHKEANLVIISMAWLTREDARSYSRAPKEPDMDTLSYWLARLEPLIRDETVGEIIVVFANRCGVEDDAVFAGTSAVLGIEDGEVKVYGILGRGERELLVVDTNGRPQAKLVSLPVKRAFEFKQEQQADKEQDTHLSDSKLERLPREEDWNIPESATNSTDSGESVRSNATNPSLWTNGSSNPGTLDTVDLCEALDVRLQTNIPHSMMDEIVTPISPVDPESPTSFFFPLKGRYPELVNLQDGLKSSIGHQEPGMTSIRPESPKIIRPPSTKSRNTSQTRRPKYQEPALISHDLADGEPLIQITPGVPLSRLGSRSPPEPDSASTMPEQTLAASPGPYQTLTPKGLLMSPRPKSACW